MFHHRFFFFFFSGRWSAYKRQETCYTYRAIGKKTGFLSYLYIKVIFLPRQARDKHRENSKKARFHVRGHGVLNLQTSVGVATEFSWGHGQRG